MWREKKSTIRRVKYREHRADRLRRRDYEGYLWTFGGHERLVPLLEIEHLLPDKDYWKCVDLTWYNIEASIPEQAQWLRLFTSTRPQRKFLMSASDRRALAAMPETLTIYRGYRKGLGRSGMSWTLSKERARFFASDAKQDRRALLGYRHSSGAPMIVRGKCHKHDVLAYFNGRKEQEIVIDPRKVFAKRSTVL